ncbi:MAG: hypothetical protein CMG96_06950, partial [Marinovum sp.]|nr:hypothetical protein [Marinovum sp.]
MFGIAVWVPAPTKIDIWKNISGIFLHLKCAIRCPITGAIPPWEARLKKAWFLNFSGGRLA